MSSQLNITPTDCKVIISSFLTRFERAKLAPTCRSCDQAVKRCALEHISKNRAKLLPEDWTEMGPNLNGRVSDLTYRQLIFSDERIERNLKDKSLIESFEEFFQVIPDARGLFGIQPNSQLHQKAERIRWFLRNTDDECFHELLVLSAQQNLPKAIKQFLTTNREISAEVLGVALNDAVEREGISSIRAILESEREITSELLNDAFRAAVMTDRIEVVQPFLQSTREFDIMVPMVLCFENAEITKAIKESKRSI